MDLSDWKLGDVRHVHTKDAKDPSVLTNTITGLLDEFFDNPAPFMGRKIAKLMDKRNSLRKVGSTLASIVQTIIKGIREAGLYGVLNDPAFNID
jgi:hypothetical protein